MINEVLDARIKNGTLLHAYIISGPNGSEKSALVNRMAASIVCSGKGSKPCGLCSDCRKAKAGIHPDIITIKKAEDKKEILVAQIREMCADAVVLPNDSNNKVYIIENADEMNVQAQNVLLKVLEEPPSFVSFILLAENSGELLETIHSRCVEVKLHSAKAEESYGDAQKTAEEFLDVIEKGTELELCEMMFRLEKLDKNIFISFIEQGYIEAINRIRQAAISGNDPRIYTETARTLKKCREYMDFNVSTGYICGSLVSSVMGLRKK